MRNFSRVAALFALICIAFTAVPRLAFAHDGGPHIRIAHLAPLAGAVDVYVNDKPLVTNVKFKDVTSYKGVDGKEFKIAVVAAGGKPTELLTKEPFTLKFDDIVHGFYTLTAVGSPKDGTFELLALPEDGVQPKAAVALGTAKVGALEITGAYARPTVQSEQHMDMPMPTAAATVAATKDAMPSMNMGAMGSVSAAYMKLANTGDHADTLVSVATDVGEAQIHQTVIQNDVASMQEMKNGLEVPAKGSVELKPGGYHVMLINLKKDLKVGDVVKLTLTFKSGTTIALDVPVKAQDSK